jgi:hypothetical protein
MKGLVYTAIFGGRDQPLAIEPEPGVDYLMFTDGPSAEGWKTYREHTNGDPRMAARHIKLNMPNRPEAQDYDWTLWIDGSHVPKVPIAPLVEKWLENADFAAYKHHHWDCTYTEIRKCIELHKDTKENLQRAERELRTMKFPEHYGQIASTILARRQNQVVKLHAACWTKRLRTMSVRDQISFMYGLWMLNDQPEPPRLHYIGPTAFNNAEFHFQGGH